MKIAIIGGGSSYTPELLDGLLTRKEVLGLSEICLMDVDNEHLQINAAFAGRMQQTLGVHCAIHHTTNLKDAILNARYVITQIRVGQIAARINDEKLGLRHGLIGQETTGIGGFACALRTIPAILNIAQTMEEINPQGFLINFTNPAGIITEAVLRNSSVRTVGLCNIPIGIPMELIKAFGGAVDDYELDYVGLNHLSWVRRILKDNKDITNDALNFFIEHAENEWEYEPVRLAMTSAMHSLGMWCNYYLQYYYAHSDSVVYQQSQNETRGESVLAIEKLLFKQYQDPLCTRKPNELSQRGGAHYSTAAFRLLEAIEHDKGSRQIVCCANRGAIPGFDDEAAVEITACLGAEGATALPQDVPAPEIRGLMQAVKAYETLTVEAAVKCDKKLAFQALMSHPLIPDVNQINGIMDELLAINRPLLSKAWF